MWYTSLMNHLAVLKRFCSAMSSCWNDASCLQNEGEKHVSPGRDVVDKQGPFRSSPFSFCRTSEQGQGEWTKPSKQVKEEHGRWNCTRQEATQRPAAQNNSCSCPKHLSLQLCQVQKAEATVGCSQERRHPAPALSPFYVRSPSGFCSQKALLGGSCEVFVPIKKKK